MPITIKCASVSGELMKISAMEFYKKVMCYPRVQIMIKEYVINKMQNFLLKTGMRYKSIRDFHSQENGLQNLINKNKVDT